jgi:hypothetical protein
MGHNNYSLKYRKFDQLYDDVVIDFRNFNLEGLIDSQNLIKIARRCNYELGWRIYRTRQDVLEIENGKVRLPDDFYILNYAFVCGEYEVVTALPQGTDIEERLIVPDYVCEPGQPDTCSEPPTDPCEIEDPCTGTCLTKCGDEYQLIQKIKTTKRVYKYSFPLHLQESSLIDCNCPNLKENNTLNKGYIENGFLYVNFDSGKVYINYMGDMIDDEGSLLVPDHELINEYYEYALKERILENLAMNGEDVSNLYSLISSKLRAARNNAYSIVNTPNFKELQKMWKTNRKAQYHKYYNMFKS